MDVSVCECRLYDHRCGNSGMFVLCFVLQIVERPENDVYVNKHSRKLVYLDLHFHSIFLFFFHFVFRFIHCYLVSVLTRERSMYVMYTSQHS